MDTGGTRHDSDGKGSHLVVVGAGGNIGSHLVPLLGRMEEVERLTLIDPDVYEEKNLSSQDITLADIGQSKVQVQARRLGSLAPGLEVTALAMAVEDVPWGLLRADVILTGLDTRRSRQAVNRRARWLGLPWLDAGVEAGGGLARVSCFGPGADQPCLECGWVDVDYRLLEQKYSCDGSLLAVPASGSPARLGALAAAWQAIECHRLLVTTGDDPHWGRQWVIAPGGAEIFSSVLTANPGCRLPGHESWPIEKLTKGPGEISLGEAFGLVGTNFANLGSVRLEVPDLDFITRLECRVCGRQRPDLLLETSLREGFALCDACGWEVPVAELNLEEGLLYADLDGSCLDWPLGRLGFRAGEVFRLGNDEMERYFQLPTAVDAGQVREERQ